MRRRSAVVALGGALGVALALLLVGCGARDEGQAPLLVFAAASLADVMEEVAEDFRAESGWRVQFSFAGSNTLARQIEAGAAADLLLSADRAQVTRLAERGLVAAGAARAVAGNELVVIVPARSARVFETLGQLTSVDRLALADPSAVPAGVYARAWLEREGVWEPVAGRVVPTLDVRAAVAAVAAGNAAAGIVYATDAASDDHVRVALRAGGAAAPDIRYWAAPISASSHPATAEFLAFLGSSAARAAFDRHGFASVGS